MNWPFKHSTLSRTRTSSSIEISWKEVTLSHKTIQPYTIPHPAPGRCAAASVVSPQLVSASVDLLLPWNKIENSHVASGHICRNPEPFYGNPPVPGGLSKKRMVKFLTSQANLRFLHNQHSMDLFQQKKNILSLLYGHPKITTSSLWGP